MGKSDDENKDWKINYEEVTSKKLKIATLQEEERRAEGESVIHIKLLWSVNVEMFPPLDLPKYSFFFLNFIKLFTFVLLSNKVPGLQCGFQC